MEPMQFRFGEWFCDAKAQEEFSTYHVKCVGDKEIGEVLDYLNVCESLDTKLNMLKWLCVMAPGSTNQ